jgi:hypothetical protein
MLREQAAVLRALARSFDIQTIRDQLLDIAALCEEIADSPVQRLHADTRKEALGIARETVKGHPGLSGFELWEG